jgi:hypothetical protein
MAAQWQLNGCCGNEEFVFLCFYGGYVLLFGLIYKTAIMKPMRLLSVFLHEFSHAFLCWITGGKVEAIEVNNNEGTHTPFFLKILKGCVMISSHKCRSTCLVMPMTKNKKSADRWCNQVSWWVSNIDHTSRICRLCFLGGIIRFHVR